MVIQSKWVVNDETKNQIIRASTLKPRLDYAINIVDKMLEVLVHKKFDLDKNNLRLYAKEKGYTCKSSEFQAQLNCEIEISFSVEALRQVRRSLDSVVGLGNIMIILSPTVSIVRTIRSRLFCLFPETDAVLGELSLILGGIIIDAGQLVGGRLDFEEANNKSNLLLDEAKLIADSKIYKQFPNVDLP